MLFRGRLSIRHVASKICYNKRTLSLKETVITMDTPFIFTHIAPKNAQPNENYPALFLLHGMGSNEQDLLQLVAPLTTPCHIFAIQGPIAHKPGYAFFQIGDNEQPVRATFDKVVLALQQFVLQAIEKYPIDINHVYLMGFNQGAVLAQSVLFTLGKIVKGAVLLSGFMPDFVREDYVKKDISEVALFIAHGQYDYIYPIKLGHQSVDFLEQCNAAVTFCEFPDGHGVTPQVQQELVAFLNKQLQQ